MDQKERRDFILQKLAAENSVKIIDLSSLLGVTRETIRRDIYEMEKEGLLKKKHGGATALSSNNETDYEIRKKEQSAEKQEIAQAAKQFITKNSSIYLDYGTTNLFLAKAITLIEDITVITNSLPIINTLIKNSGQRIIIPGGVVRRNENSLCGFQSLQSVENIFVDIGFFSCAGISSEHGITNYHNEESLLSQKMVNHSKKMIVVADHTKFDNVALHKFADLSDVDIIITDHPFTDEWMIVCKQYNIQYIQVTPSNFLGIQ